jgi:5-hmdU DNA kinase, helical domain
MRESTKTKLRPGLAPRHGIVRTLIEESETHWQKSGPEIYVRKSPPLPSPVFDTYWRFAGERQSIFHARTAGNAAPWTQDQVLKQYKFTNAYRASDRVSQYLIRNVIYAGEHDWPSTLLRILLFKVFNKPATWELLESQVGQISTTSFSPDRVSKVLDEAFERGGSIYSGAYIMPSGPASIRQPRKHIMHVTLLTNVARGTLARDLQAAKSMESAYHFLLGVPSFGPFLAFQFLIDANYSPFLNFSEMDFVVPGPGARDGIRKCFTDLGDYNIEDTIRWVTDRQEREFEARGLHFQTLWGRPLQLIDCQNLFCEVDKYARVAHPEIKGVSGRTRIKQRFCPNPERIIPWFPPKWRLNERIEADLGSARPLARIS